MKNIEEITIRPVTEADAEKLLAIYAPYVTDTFVTYEYTVPTVEEFRERIRNTLQAYPYFAAVENGRIIGYAYASAFHPRRAYLWSAEATVYLERGVRGRGVGRLLYERLEETLKQQNVQNVTGAAARAMWTMRRFIFPDFPFFGRLTDVFTKWMGKKRSFS